MSEKQILDKITGQTIAFIGQKGIPAEFVGTSGVEFYVESRALELVRFGKTVICYTRPWATPEEKTDHRGISLVSLPTINTKHLDAPVHSFLSTIHAILSPVDVIWYQASGPALFSFIPKLFGKKVIVTIHTLEWKRSKWGPVAKAVLKLGEIIGIKSANILITVSAELAAYIKQKYHRDAIIDGPKVETIIRIKPHIISQKYGLKGNDYVLYLGRFVPEKRIEWLIRAYQEIKPDGLKLVLAGGSSHTDEYEKKLKLMAHGSRLMVNSSKKDQNIIFTGYVFGTEKQEILNNCGLLVIPSAVEGSPIVLNELPRNKLILMNKAFIAPVPHTRFVVFADGYDEFKFALKRAIKQIKPK